MTDPGLRRRYRRLLWAYPNWYRRERGQEILTTLLDAAQPGQRRPTGRDVVDVLGQGIRCRLRPPRGPVSWSGEHDTIDQAGPGWLGAAPIPPARQPRQAGAGSGWRQIRLATGPAGLRRVVYLVVEPGGPGTGFRPVLGDRPGRAAYDLRMSDRGEDAAHAWLLQLLAERATGPPTGRQREAARDREIEELAARLGLAPEELDGLTPAMVEAARRPPDLAGRFRIYRRARTVLPFLFALVLLAIVAQMGQPLPAAVGLVLLVAGWAVRGRIAVARFDVDPYGRLHTHRHGPIDWCAVEELTFRYRRPWLVSRDRIESLAGTTAQVRIRRRDGGAIRLAQGQLFRIRPGRRPVHLADLARFLRRQVRAAGMTVQDLGDGQWRAYRPASG